MEEVIILQKSQADIDGIGIGIVDVPELVLAPDLVQARNSNSTAFNQATSLGETVENGLTDASNVSGVASKVIDTSAIAGVDSKVLNAAIKGFDPFNCIVIKKSKKNEMIIIWILIK